MHFFSSTVYCLLFTVYFLLLPAAGRAADAERVKFDTVDLVTIHGSFYPGNAGKKSPCAILLHPIGANSQMEGWDSLAKKLQGKGFAVLTFDFRGHGDSTSVEQGFWRDPVNRTLKSYRPGKLKDQIHFKDFTSPRQYAMLVNDIAAAKHFLSQRNDSGECNSGNVVVIGAESGATLGALWVRTEWQRRRILTSVPVVTSPTRQMEGQDILCTIWLSITPYVGKVKLPVDTWLRTPDVREKVPMFFLYGDGDAAAAKYARHLYQNVMHADSDKQLKYTIIQPVKDTKLAGQELLGKPSLNTEEMILSYVARLQQDRGVERYSKRDADRIPVFRVPIETFVP
jgi:pimeloyl-ACP methyl ester carboxylesterase